LAGHSVQLPCKSAAEYNVSWLFQSRNGREVVISSSGRLNAGFDKHYLLLISKNGWQNLTIKQADEEDAGLYVCTEAERQDNRHYVKLIVEGIQLPV
jgi:Immunoglobulin V-set domain